MKQPLFYLHKKSDFRIISKSVFVRSIEFIKVRTRDYILKFVYLLNMKPDLSKSAIKKQRNNAEIIKLTTEQIIKDFALFGMAIEFPEDMNYAYYDLFDQLHEHIAHMWDTDNNILVSLLYRIDLSEKAIWKKKDEYPDISVTRIITELTIERELKKVLTRKFFSGLTDSNPESLTD